MDRQPLRGRHEIEATFAPSHERFPQHREVVFARQPCQLRPRESGPRHVACRVEQLAYPQARDLADVDAGAVLGQLQRGLRVGA